jgi:hypothetical protein
VLAGAHFNVSVINCDRLTFNHAPAVVMIKSFAFTINEISFILFSRTLLTLFCPS